MTKLIFGLQMCLHFCTGKTGWDILYINILYQWVLLIFYHFTQTTIRNCLRLQRCIAKVANRKWNLLQFSCHLISRLHSHQQIFISLLRSEAKKNVRSKLICIRLCWCWTLKAANCEFNQLFANLLFIANLRMSNKRSFTISINFHQKTRWKLCKKLSCKCFLFLRFRLWVSWAWMKKSRAQVEPNKFHASEVFEANSSMESENFLWACSSFSCKFLIE